MYITILDPSDEKEWDKYILINKYTDFLQSFCWAKILKIAYGFKPIFLEVQKGDNPIAYFSLHEKFLYIVSDKIKHKITNFFGKLFTKYLEAIGGPVILEDNKTEEVIINIIEWLEIYAKKNHIQRINLTPFKYNELYAVNPAIKSFFESYGYSTKTEATYLINLNQGEESLWKYIKHSARKALKQTMKTNLVIKKTKSFKDYIEKFILPYNEMEKEFGRLEFPVSIAKKISEFDLMNKYYHYFYAEIYEKIVGVLGMYVYNGYATEIMSSTSKYAYNNKIYAQDLLHWQMMLEAKRMGCHTFDLAGVNPNPQTTKEIGIRRFKEKWGGKYIEYNVYSKDMKPTMNRIINHLSMLLKKIRGSFRLIA